MDRTDQNLRLIENWTVVPTICRNRHSVACEIDFNKLHRKNFREQNTINSFRAKKPSYFTTLNAFNTEGANIDSVSSITKEREDHSVRRKMTYKKPDDNYSRVPPNARSINLFNLDSPELDAENHMFLQHEDEEITAFFLDSELEQLQGQDWYCDGTFTLMKYLQEQQVYIVARLFESEDGTRVFTYPIAFFFLKKK